MAKCLHLTFEASVDVGRITATGNENEEAEQYRADVKIQCATCKEPFCFVGLPMGLDPLRPTMSVDEEEARLVIRPASQTVKAIGPGFYIKDTTPRKRPN